VPELPDVAVYVERLVALFAGEPLERLRVVSPWVLRSYDPPPSDLEGRVLRDVRRIGKRIVLDLEGDRYAVIHLMVTGRLRLRDPGSAVPRKRGLAAFDFPNRTVLFTEEGTTKRASLHLHRDAAAVAAHDRGGIDPLAADLASYTRALTSERHTLKRSLTDPRLFGGIGGAYADEIMHRARLSPTARSDTLDADAVARLRDAAVAVLTEWTDRLRAEVGDGFPEKVTAFHPEMAVHGKFAEPCPMCGAPVQRIRYASNETNYCPGCQTGGRILADRALSRILKDDWPTSLDDLDA
jgi:formamidopyrimidine-DNA glycosylase